MQEVIKFDLKGLSATIHKPESNTTYFTYNNTHKIMLYGLLGAIIGLNGYQYNTLIDEKNKMLPEFYTKLQHLKIAVKPNVTNGNFIKKIQQFNNSVGYANINDSIPTTLIVSEQWLENPCWTIYLLGDTSNEYITLKDYLIHRKCEYIPYIGKNDHFANITNVSVQQVDQAKNISKIHSIFTDVKYQFNDIEEEFIAFEMQDETSGSDYIVKEVLPTKLHPLLGYTDFKEFIYTNQNLKIQETIPDIYQIEGENIFFF